MAIRKPSPARKPRPALLEASLRRRLSGARRLAVLAVGSSLRGDDAAGLLAGRELQRLLPPAGAPGGPATAVFFAETSPENLTGEIKRFLPSHVLVLDAAESGAEPGRVGLVELGDVGGAAASTHSLRLGLLFDYLRRFVACEFVVVGIQPGNMEFDAPPSPPVVAAARRAAEAVAAALARPPRRRAA